MIRKLILRPAAASGEQSAVGRAAQRSMTNGEKLNVPENAEVELTVHDVYVLPPTAVSDEERSEPCENCLQAGTRTPFAQRV